MAARVRQIRNSLIGMIEAAWTRGPNDEVVPDYIVDIDLFTSGKLTGRKIYVLPDAYTGFPATRAEDTTDYAYSVWFCERYEGAGCPGRDWVEERIDFVDELASLLGDFRRVPYMATEPGVYPQEGDVVQIYDIIDLSENKLFVAQISLLLREDAEA